MRSRIAVTMVAAAILVGGYGVVSGGGDPGTANLWIDTNGGTCARSGTQVAYSDEAACSSIQASVAACTAGDTIRMKAGTSYGNQTITTNRTSPGCTVIGEGSGDTRLVTVGDLQTDGDWLELQNIVASNWDAAGSGTGDPHNITLRNMDLTGGAYVQNCCRDISIIGGRWHDNNAINASITFSGDSAALQVEDILIEGVEFYGHDCTPPPADAHFEVLRGQGWLDGWTVRNNYFHDNQVNTGHMHFDAFNGGTYRSPTNIVVEGNYFAATAAPPCGSGEAAFFQINANGQGIACPTVDIRYNTAVNTPLATRWDSAGANCSSGSEGNVILRGNISPKGSVCSGTYSNNVWINASPVNCGTGDQTVASGAAAGLTGDGFHIADGSVAEAAGVPGLCPAADRDGTARPTPVATTCDAGADERD